MSAAIGAMFLTMMPNQIDWQYKKAIACYQAMT
jgi:hypothetical protein